MLISFPCQEFETQRQRYFLVDDVVSFGYGSTIQQQHADFEVMGEFPIVKIGGPFFPH